MPKSSSPRTFRSHADNFFPRRHLRRAFTLVELLVVIGIVALLISLLLPALNKARQSANNLKCLSNLRSLGQGLNLYADANRGSLPWGHYMWPVPSYADWTTWYLQVQGTLTGSATLWADALSTGANTAGGRDLFLCPEAPSLEKDPNVGICHYMCHPGLMPDWGAWWNQSPPIQAKPYKLSAISTPSETMMLFDGSLQPQLPLYGAVWSVSGDDAVANLIDGETIWSNNWYGPMHFTEGTRNPWKPAADSIDMSTVSGNVADCNTDSSNNQSTIRFRHMRETQSNVLMADGHVESFTLNPTLAPNDPGKTNLTRKYLYLQSASW